MAIAVKGTDGQDIEATGWSDSSPLGEQTQQCWDGTSRIITECFEKETTPFAPGWINGPNDYQFYQMEFRVLNSRDSRHSLLLGGDNTLKQVTNVTSTTSSLSATKTETSTITLSSTLSTSTSLGDLAPTGDSGSSNKGAIIGGAVGGSLALLLLLGLLFFFLYRRRKSNEPVEIGAGHEKVHLQLHDGVSETNWKNLPEIYTTPAQLPATLNELGHSAELPANTPELEDLDIDR